MAAKDLFHNAVKQALIKDQWVFLNYRLALQMQKPDHTLYLAVPADTFEVFFQEPFIQAAVESYQVKLIVYKPLQESIILWKD
ncbi:MAG: element excision factor XisH family protein [Spirulinaceae cyanobacterium]